MSSVSEKEIEKEWDAYWAGKSRAGNSVYDFFAEIYRKLLIKNILNHFVKKYFKEGAKVLHAGCGSGQVDVDIKDYVNITALDISGEALAVYRKTNGAKSRTVQGSIFSMPFANNAFDGFYNLGVLEHFTQEDIQKILIECRRVLKPGGKAIVLWPPVFGFTVFVLDTAHFILNKIFRMNIKLHPDEITRVKSREHAVKTFKDAGFDVIEYYFGPRDLFTQVVVVAQKPRQKV